MRVTLNRKELSTVLNDAEKVAPTNSPLDAMKGVLLEAENGTLTLTATNLEFSLKQSIPADIEETGAAVFTAKLLANMVRLMDDDTVTLRTIGKHQLEVCSGNAVYTASMLNIADFPRLAMPFPEDSVCVTGIPNIVKRTSFAVGEDVSKPLMRCVNLIFSDEGLKAVGSDSFRIVAAQGDKKSKGEISLLVPASSLEKLAHLISNTDTLQVGTTGKHIVFTKDNFMFSARLMEGKPLDGQAMIDMAKPLFSVLTDAEVMRNEISSVLCVADGRGKLMLRFDGSNVTLKCTGDMGEATGTLNVVALSGAPTGEYWYNGRQLYECLRAQNGTMMLDVAQSGILLMRTDELVCMQTSTRAPIAKSVAPKKMKEPSTKAA